MKTFSQVEDHFRDELWFQARHHSWGLWRHIWGPRRHICCQIGNKADGEVRNQVWNRVWNRIWCRVNEHIRNKINECI